MGALSRITNAKFQKAEVTITMLKVHSASIKNYRAIENLEFSPNSINVFVGPNNCGKSSVLEAIALKEKIAYFDDIQKTDKGLQVFLKNQDASLPVSSMGDGFRSLLSLTFMNSLAGEGVIILEEPEVSLHPGFMYILCEAILKNSKESQFFISTHSMDFVRALLNVLKWEGQTDDIHIIRMFTGLATQSPDIEVLSGDDALNDIEEIGRDLRGI